MIELWKPLPIAPCKYEVSNKGNVRSITRLVKSSVGDGLRGVKGRLLKQQMNCNGYKIIALSLEGRTKTFTVHQLVALSFIPEFIKGTMINHKDGNPTNNQIDNLEVSNPSHNMLHAVATGLRPKVGKTSKFCNVSYISSNRHVKKWVGCLSHSGNSSYGWKTFNTEVEAALHVDALLNSIGDTQRNRNFP